MTEETKNPNVEVTKLLQQMHNSWSDINTDENGVEFRYPANRRELRKTKKILQKIYSLNYDDEDLVESVKRVEKKVAHADAIFPKLKENIVTALIFFFLTVIGLTFLFSMNTYKYPEINYDPEWFLTKEAGSLFWKSSDDNKDVADVITKVKLRKGTQLKPIAQINSRWFQVETKDGQRGFIPYTMLTGGKFVKAKKTVWSYKKIGEDRSDTIAAGTMATSVAQKTADLKYRTERFLKLKLEDGRTRWVLEKNFNKLIFDSIPKINPAYSFSTNLAAIQKNILGDSLKGIEKKYGPASSYLNDKNTRQAYFQYINVFDGKNHQKGILVLFNENGLADSIKFIDSGRSYFYDKIPLVSQLRGLEITKIINYSFYLDNIPDLKWWQNFKDYWGWITRSIAWLINMALLGIAFILFYSLGRLIAGPFMQLFAYTRLLGNSSVKFVNFMVILLFTYLLYIYTILLADQWFFIGLLTIGTTYFWYSIHSSTIDFDRCPSCHSIYSAIDFGTTQEGISKRSSSEKVDHYVGTDVSKSGNTTVYTKNYLRLNKRTTDVYQNYTENRICKLCGHEWGIKMAKKLSSHSSYD